MLLLEAVMYGRSVTEVARELGRPRSTVKSWIARIPSQLARDPYLLRKLAGK